jgi:anti-anti-sigma factor
LVGSVDGSVYNERKRPHHRGDATRSGLHRRADRAYRQQQRVQPADQHRNLISAGEKAIVIDFAAIAYLTSAAFRALLVASDQAEKNGTQLALCGVVGQVRELFEMGGLLQAFAIHGSREDACAKLA